MNEIKIITAINLYSCYEIFCEPPADFIEECRQYWENIERIRTAKEKAPQIFYAIELDGTMYFYHGNTRIKVTEHFSDHGRPMTDLVEDVVQFAAQN